MVDPRPRDPRNQPQHHGRQLIDLHSGEKLQCIARWIATKTTRAPTLPNFRWRNNPTPSKDQAARECFLPGCLLFRGIIPTNLAGAFSTRG